MTERDKLQAALQAYYAAQSYEAPAGTWQEVAAQQGLLPKRKKRRAIILLFLIAGLTVLVGTFYWQEPAQLHIAAKTNDNSNKRKTVAMSSHATSKNGISIGDNNRGTFETKSNAVSTPSSKAISDKHTAGVKETLSNAVPSKEKTAPSIAPVAAAMQANNTEGSFIYNTDVKTNTSPLSSAEVSNANNHPANNGAEIALAAPTKASAEDLTISTPTRQIADVTAIDKLNTANALLPGDTSKTPFNTGSKQLYESDTTKDIQKSDSVAAAGIVSNDSSNRGIRPHFYFNEGLQVDLGTYYSFGWKTPDKRDAAGFSASAGGYYSSKIQSRIWVGGGLRYFEVRNLSYSSKTSRSSSFTYGENVLVTTITPVSLHYLSVPISAMYALTTKHYIGIATNLNYLLNVNANVSSLEQRPGYTSSVTTVKQSGYMQGFSWFDSQLALLYRYRFNSAMAAQAELMAGIKDVKENVFFNLQQKEKNCGIRISFVYYLKNASTRDVE